MMRTHFEACEEYISTTENETKSGKAVGKKLIASEYCMVKVPWIVLSMTENIARTDFVGVASQCQESPIAGVVFSV